VQDAFWTVVRKIDTFRGESAFGSGSTRIVANAAYQSSAAARAVSESSRWTRLLPFSTRVVATPPPWCRLVAGSILPSRSSCGRRDLGPIDELPCHLPGRAGAARRRGAVDSPSTRRKTLGLHARLHDGAACAEGFCRSGESTAPRRRAAPSTAR